MADYKNLREILETIKAETRPIENHTDPNALEDCWAEVFEQMEATTREVSRIFSDVRKINADLSVLLYGGPERYSAPLWLNPYWALAEFGRGGAETEETLSKISDLMSGKSFSRSVIYRSMSSLEELKARAKIDVLTELARDIPGEERGSSKAWELIIKLIQRNKEAIKPKAQE